MTRKTDTNDYDAYINKRIGFTVAGCDINEMYTLIYCRSGLKRRRRTRNKIVMWHGCVKGEETSGNSGGGGGGGGG